MRLSERCKERLPQDAKEPSPVVARYRVGRLRKRQACLSDLSMQIITIMRCNIYAQKYVYNQRGRK